METESVFKKGSKNPNDEEIPSASLAENRRKCVFAFCEKTNFVIAFLKRKTIQTVEEERLETESQKKKEFFPPFLPDKETLKDHVILYEAKRKETKYFSSFLRFRMKLFLLYLQKYMELMSVKSKRRFLFDC